VLKIIVVQVKQIKPIIRAKAAKMSIHGMGTACSCLLTASTADLK
jgi:hypothetical protein